MVITTIEQNEEEEKNKNIVAQQSEGESIPSRRRRRRRQAEEEEDHDDDDDNIDDRSTTRSDHKKSVPLHKLFAFADGFDYFLMALGSLGAIGHGLAFPMFFFFLGGTMHDLGSQHPHQMYHSVSKVALNLVFLGLVFFASSWTEIACWIQTGERQSMKMRIRYLEAILQHDIAYFDIDARTGELVDSISSNSLIIQQAISEKMGNLIHHVSTFISGLALGFVNGVWQMGLLTLATVPLTILVAGLAAHFMTSLAAKTQKSYEQAGNIAEESISQVRTVYSFVSEERTRTSYSAALSSTVNVGYRAGLVRGLGVGLLYSVPFGVWALLMWYGGVLVRNGTTHGGQVLSTIFCVLMGAFAIGQTSPSIAAIANARAAASRILGMVAETTANDSSKLKGTCLEHVHGEIEFHDVSFNYPARPQVPIFQNFNLKVPSGASVAIVGPSGSGKSTVISLLERFYEPNSGQILLDGHNIQSLQLKWYRAQIGLVNQEPALFATTILENILYGKEDANLEQVEMAAKAANAHEFIVHLPQGYSTQVGTGGVQLSGGQKQRVAIARALLKDPSMLLLDEATSALDAEAEKVVQEALNRVMVARTTLIVAHRLSTIQNADAIAVLQDGKLIQTGTHDQLVAEGGAYSALIHLQESNKSKEEASSRLSSCSSSRANSFRRQSSEHSGGSFRLSKLRILSFTSREEDEDDLKVVGGTTDSKPVKSLFLKLMKLNLQELPILSIGFLGAVCSGLPNPIFSFMVAKVLNVYYVKDLEQMKHSIERYTVILVVVGVGSLVAHIIQYYYFGVAGVNLTKRVREMMLSAILRNEVSWFDEESNNSSRLAARLASDAMYMRSISGDIMASLAQNITVITAAFTIAFIAEWRMAIVVAAVFPIIAMSFLTEKLFVRGLAGDLESSHARAAALAGEAVTNIRTVTAFNAQEKLVKLLTQELHVPATHSCKRGNIFGITFGAAILCLFASYGLGLWYGALLLRSGKTDFKGVETTFIVLVMAGFPIAESMSLFPDMSQARCALKSVFQILDRPTKIEPDIPNAENVKNLRGEIEFRNVEFCYPSRPEVTIFKCLNLKVRAAACMALVGASGSGKSSIISLVERFYDPVKGFVLVDGRNVRKLNLRSYRKHVGLVQQEPALFAASILDNIKYGKAEDATESEIIEAAKAANAHSFISALPGGYKTNVGERGTQLSGGQKQRVAIARAVLKNPSILLLDEATSALDAESEHIVQEALDRLMKGRTSIVVAHRLSTIRNADQIAVLEGGEVVEVGSHSELVAKGGAYARLIELQTQKL